MEWALLKFLRFVKSLLEKISPPGGKMYSFSMDGEDVFMHKQAKDQTLTVKLSDSSVEKLYDATKGFSTLHDLINGGKFNPREYGIYFKGRIRNLPSWW
jgi:hypothetical protein